MGGITPGQKRNNLWYCRSTFYAQSPSFGKPAAAYLARSFFG